MQILIRIGQDILAAYLFLSFVAWLAITLAVVFSLFFWAAEKVYDAVYYLIYGEEEID